MAVEKPSIAQGDRAPWHRSMASQFAQLLFVRLLESFRDATSWYWAFVFPLLLAGALAVAFRGGRPRVIAVVVTGDASRAEHLAASLAQDSLLNVSAVPEARARRALRTGAAALLVSVPEGGMLAYEYDQSRAEARLARMLVDRMVQRAGGTRDAITVSDVQTAERGARYIDFVIPGLLGMNLMSGGLWEVALTIVEARRGRLLKRLAVTPMSRALYLAAHVASCVALLLLQAAVLIVSSVLVFGVPVRGSLGGLCLIVVLSAFTFASLGMLLGARQRSTTGVSGLINFVMLPMWMVSGVFFPTSRFPERFQSTIAALPLTAVIDAVRGSMIEGTTLLGIVRPLVTVLAWAVLSFGLAVRLFRWQ
jgi:ABC-2 type transport system permease protein